METEFVNLAMGRIFGMMSRPYRPGDDAEYARCRGIILDRVEARPDDAPCYVRDRNRGAAGD